MIRTILSIGVMSVLVPQMSIAGPVESGKTYAGIQYSVLEFDVDGLDENLEPDAGVVRFGHFFVNNLALEGRVGFGLGDDSQRESSGIVDAELDRLFGIYVAGHIPVGSAASIYGLVGYTDAEADFSAGPFSVSGSDSGGSFGAGVDLYLGESVGLNAEYVRYLEEDDYEFSAMSAGVKFMF